MHNEPGLPSLLRFSYELGGLRHPAYGLRCSGAEAVAACLHLGCTAGLSAAEAKATRVTTRPSSASGASLGELLQTPPACFGGWGARLQPAAAYRSSEQRVG